jgi:hypothetical protein
MKLPWNIQPVESTEVSGVAKRFVMANCYDPSVAMQMYDAKTVAVNAHVRQSYTIISQTNPRVYASGLLNPQIPATELTPVLGTLK